jgi:lipoyl(octanoyl) transferase
METGMNLVRLAPFAEADGGRNMAADETLLENAAAGAASLRFYGWSEPVLSLGYFQSHAVRQSDPGLAALAWVRRPTGGAALVHHHELTYALALPAGSPWQQRGHSWLHRMHAILADALASFGVIAESVVEEVKRGEVLCFLHHTPGDLRIDGAKIVGSAQRRQRGALLQHGAVLLAASPYTPALPGVVELSGRRLSPKEVAAAIEQRFTYQTGWRLDPVDWMEQERGRIETLAAEKYLQPAWNTRR